MGTLHRMDDAVLKKLFPSLGDDELQKARENLDAYLELAWEIYEDIKAAQGDVDPNPKEL
jgi:hypothetical protein